MLKNCLQRKTNKVLCLSSWLYWCSCHIYWTNEIQTLFLGHLNDILRDFTIYFPPNIPVQLTVFQTKLKLVQWQRFQTVQTFYFLFLFLLFKQRVRYANIAIKWLKSVVKFYLLWSSLGMMLILEYIVKYVNFKFFM